MQTEVMATDAPSAKGVKIRNKAGEEEAKVHTLGY
jgi:hypothetical protein